MDQSGKMLMNSRSGSMLSGCSQAVHMAGISLVQLGDLYSLCTARAKYLTSQVFLYGLASTACEQLKSLFAQASSAILSLLSNLFYTLYTGPIVTTKNK